MKKLSNYFLMLLSLVSITYLSSCDSTTEDPADPKPTITISQDAPSSAEVGDNVSFNVSVVAQSKIESIEVRLGTDDYDLVEDNFTNPESHTYEFNYPVDSAVAGSTLQFAFIVTDKKGNEAQASYTLEVASLETPMEFEETGATIGNAQGPQTLLGAFDLARNMAIASAAPADSTDMQNTTVDEGGPIIWSKGWEAENATRFVKDNDYDYDNATTESARDAYEAGTSTGLIEDVAAEDIYLARLRGGDDYVVIKILSVDDEQDDNEEIITFSYKKETETSGL